MDPQAFELLSERLNRIEDKVDVLLTFKWQIIGGATVISAIVSILVSIVMAKGI